MAAPEAAKKSKSKTPTASVTPAKGANVDALVGMQSAHSSLVAFLYQSHGPKYDEYVVLLEKKTQLKREQLSYILGGLLALYLVLGGLASFVCNLIGFAYPSYVSVKAIRTTTKDDDTHWLIYWTVFGFFSLIDCFAEPIMAYFPFYFLLKVIYAVALVFNIDVNCIFLLYLYLPQTNGAIHLYHKYVDPFITTLDKFIDNYKNKKA